MIDESRVVTVYTLNTKDLKSMVTITSYLGYYLITFCYRVVKFSSVHHLTMHFPRNFGSEITKVYYIGLRGEFTQAHRHGVTICTYEARPNISDHKTENIDHVNYQIQ